MGGKCLPPSMAQFTPSDVAVSTSSARLQTADAAARRLAQVHAALSRHIGSYPRGESKPLNWARGWSSNDSRKRYSRKNKSLTLNPAFRNASNPWSRYDLLEGWSRTRKRQMGRRAFATTGTVTAVALKVVVEGSIRIACR